MIFKNVNIKKDGHLGVLQIDRKNFNNALNIDTSYEIIKGLKELEKDKKIKFDKQRERKTKKFRIY